MKPAHTCTECHRVTTYYHVGYGHNVCGNCLDDWGERGLWDRIMAELECKAPVAQVKRPVLRLIRGGASV